MYYYIFCKEFSIESGKINSYVDDNNGEGYSLEEAEDRQKELHTLTTSTGHLTGTEARIYSFDGECAG